MVLLDKERYEGCFGRNPFNFTSQNRIQVECTAHGVPVPKTSLSLKDKYKIYNLLFNASGKCNPDAFDEGYFIVPFDLTAVQGGGESSTHLLRMLSTKCLVKCHICDVPLPIPIPLTCQEKIWSATTGAHRAKANALPVMPSDPRHSMPIGNALTVLTKPHVPFNNGPVTSMEIISCTISIIDGDSRDSFAYDSALFFTHQLTLHDHFPFLMSKKHRGRHLLATWQHIFDHFQALGVHFHLSPRRCDEPLSSPKATGVVDPGRSDARNHQITPNHSIVNTWHAPSRLVHHHAVAKPVSRRTRASKSKPQLPLHGVVHEPC